MGYDKHALLWRRLFGCKKMTATRNGSADRVKAWVSVAYFYSALGEVGHGNWNRAFGVVGCAVG